MAPTSLLKDLSKLKHPNSRKTLSLARKAKRFNNRNKIKLGHAIKSNVMGERFSWFTERLESFPNQDCLTTTQFAQLIEVYLERFDEEIEQINLKKSISKNRAGQHASRLSVLEMNKERERDEYNGAGIEIMDLCDPVKYSKFTSWDGNSINLQHFKLDRISRKHLEKSDASEEME